MANRLTIKGQVTIPKEIREFLGLTSGDSQVEFSIGPAGEVVLKKADRQTPSTFQSFRGRAGQGAGRSGIDVLSLLSGIAA